MSVALIVNPAAGRGRRAGRIAAYRELVRRRLPDHVEYTTHGPGEEAELTARALSDGHDAIVTVGGDGTASLVAHHILSAERGDVRFGVLPAGTGNDFGKTIGARAEWAERIVGGLVEGRTRRVDVGRVGRRHFLNVFGAGFDIAVIEDAASMPFLRGDALYQFCALRQLFRFPGLPLEIAAEGEVPRRIDHLMLVIANANYFGGSFHIAPNASLEDGRLDAVSIGNAGPVERARLFRLVGKGRHVGHPKVLVQQSPRFELRFGGTLHYELDGEVLASNEGRLVVESVPSALDVFVPTG
jgi:diacylglycerol kinase (ATP)